MKNITIVYITLLVISIFLPFILVENFLLAEEEFLMYYVIVAAMFLLAIISAYIKDHKIRTILLPLFSFFTMLFSGLHVLLSTLVLVLGVARYLDQSSLFFVLIGIFQLALCVLAAKHIHTEKIEPSKPTADDVLHF